MKYVRKNNIKILEKHPEDKSGDMSNRMPGDMSERISEDILERISKISEIILGKMLERLSYKFSEDILESIFDNNRI